MMAVTQKTVYDVVVATVADYDRMKKLLEKGNVTRDQLALFTRKVTAVDNALKVVCDGEPEAAIDALRYDIANRNGFENASAREYYNTYYSFRKRKNDAIRLMAKMMNLI